MAGVFLPKLMYGKVAYLNLNEEAKKWMVRNGVTDPRIFGDPGVTHAMEEEAHMLAGLDWSYGGDFEDRSTIRKGVPYLDETQCYTHLGIDLNVNPGVSVFACLPGPVVYMGDDTDTFGPGGWGGHVIQLARLPFGGPVAVLYAHLGECIGKKVLLPDWDEKTRVLRVGTIGDTPRNGGWRPHLHVQIMRLTERQTRYTTADWQRYSDELDGYIHERDIPEYRKLSVDPTPYVFGNIFG